MGVYLVHTVHSDPERQARIAEHQARVQAELAAGIEEERQAIERRRQERKAKRSPPLNFARPKREVKPKPRRKPWWAKLVRKIDRVNTMAANPGWST